MLTLILHVHSPSLNATVEPLPAGSACAPLPRPQLQSARAAYSIVQEALADQAKLIRWYRARSAGLSTAAIAAALAAVGADVASLAALGGSADADTIISAKVELLEEKQVVMRQLVAVDDSFAPPPDYKVSMQCVWRCVISECRI